MQDTRPPPYLANLFVTLYPYSLTHFSTKNYEKNY